MTTLTSTWPAVVAGVDTHLDVHVAAVCDPVGRVLDTADFPATTAGYQRLLAWARGHGHLEHAGVEGTGSYGAGLSRYLTGQGVAVREVNRTDRQARRRHGKTDTTDAIAAARAVLAGTATGTPKTQDGPVEAIRMLRMVIRGAHKARTQAFNQLHHLVLTASAPLRERLGTLKGRKLVQACAALRPGSEGDLTSVTKLTLRETALRIIDLQNQIRRLKPRLAKLVTATAPALITVHGVGPDTAAALLIAAGDNPDRLSNERAFAALCGASPVPASSGKTTRHRLNRGGDRQANAALWRIAIVRMRSHPATRDYLARRTHDGKTKGEIIRCLKRALARELYPLLRQPAA